jgi:hypothetical protein
VAPHRKKSDVIKANTAAAADPVEETATPEAETA